MTIARSLFVSCAIVAHPYLCLPKHLLFRLISAIPCESFLFSSCPGARWIAAAVFTLLPSNEVLVFLFSRARDHDSRYTFASFGTLGTIFGGAPDKSGICDARTLASYQWDDSDGRYGIYEEWLPGWSVEECGSFECGGWEY